MNNHKKNINYINHVNESSTRLINNGDLRIPLHATTHSQLFVRDRAIKTWMAYQVTYATHHHSVLSRINYFQEEIISLYRVSLIIKLLSCSTLITIQYS